MTKNKTIGPFAPEDFNPKSGEIHTATTSGTMANTKARDKIMRSIYIQNPNHAPVFRALDMVLSLGVKGEYQTGVRNAAPSFAGKSAAADKFGRMVSRRGTFLTSTNPVVRVELEQACTPKRFWSTILAKYGDGFAASKDEEGLRRSAYDAFEKYGTKLLIIDEVQHAGYRSNGLSVPTDVIKRFISDAQVGLGLFGNEDALVLLQSNSQLSHRLQEPCDIKPLNLTDSTEQERFRAFVGRYDDALVAKGLFEVSPWLRDQRVIECLMAISGGFLGRVVTLLQIAGRRAFLRGATSIELGDISHAATTWAVEQRLTPINPFLYGIRKTDA